MYDGIMLVLEHAENQEKGKCMTALKGKNLPSFLFYHRMGLHRLMYSHTEHRKLRKEAHSFLASRQNFFSPIFFLSVPEFPLSTALGQREKSS